MRFHRLTPVAIPARGMAVLVVLATAALTWHLWGPHFPHSFGGHGPAVAALPEAHHDQSEHHRESEYHGKKHCEDAEPCPGDGHADTCGYLLQQDSEAQLAPTVDAVWQVCGDPGRTPFAQDTGSQRSRAPPDPVRELQVIRV